MIKLSKVVPGRPLIVSVLIEGVKLVAANILARAPANLLARHGTKRDAVPLCDPADHPAPRLLFEASKRLRHLPHCLELEVHLVFHYYLNLIKLSKSLVEAFDMSNRAHRSSHPRHSMASFSSSGGRIGVRCSLYVPHVPIPLVETSA